MTLEQMIADTIEVTNYLRERFGQDKIYLMGHSWGSLLSVHTATQRPDLFYAYIGIGQTTRQAESEKLAYNHMLTVAQITDNRKLEKQLLKYTIEDSVTVTSLQYVKMARLVMDKQGICLMHELKSRFCELILPILLLQEYKIGQKINWVRGEFFSLTYLWNTVIEQDLFKEVPKLEIPVYICHGIYDYQTSYQLSKGYFDVLEAPYKQFYTFENSAHSPIFEEPERFMQIMTTDVLGK